MHHCQHTMWSEHALPSVDCCTATNGTLLSNESTDAWLQCFSLSDRAACVAPPIVLHRRAEQSKALKKIAKWLQFVSDIVFTMCYMSV